MPYPSLEEVERADKVTLAKWFRFLPAPGTSVHRKRSTREFEEVWRNEMYILNRILERFEQEGGMTPDLSRIIGW